MHNAAQVYISIIIPLSTDYRFNIGLRQYQTSSTDTDQDQILLGLVVMETILFDELAFVRPLEKFAMGLDF